ncbi:Tetratricopeptide repeat protein [Pirellulimonas nuda]|uniref:Tetratricopeptide repeat protein n=1 Tax=Pirellulimonas nuda TaxID=2528009 RepID=A0A518D933_9BACT|nr:tetratricopeptide repeat protein [Pirellulimonas nuda]QDU87986.1 Tetratricopeptide repeat protein [Pirellulimonas nuda]
MSPRRNMLPRIAALALLAGAALPSAHAHPPVEHVIEALTRRIAEGEPAAELLVRRGDERRGLRRNGQAADDYAAALRIDPRLGGAWLGLARVRLAQGRYAEARSAAEQGVAAQAGVGRQAQDPEQVADAAAPFYATIAQAYEAQHKFEQATDAWRRALGSANPEIDWRLGLARSLQNAGRPEEARDALAADMQQNPSVVLQRAWVAALIECGDLSEASAQVEAGLARSRWRGSWLLLRAQIAARAGLPQEARRDAQAVIDEIDARTRPGVSNPLLEEDRAAAERLLRQAGGGPDGPSP